MGLFRKSKIKELKKSISRMSDAEVLTAYEICVVSLRNIQILKILLCKESAIDEMEKVKKRCGKLVKLICAWTKDLHIAIIKRGLEGRMVQWAAKKEDLLCKK